MTYTTLDTFRKRMKEIRINKNITLKEIAEAVGCKEATIQRYESGNGIKNVSYETIVTIAETLEVTPQYLVGWESPSSNKADLLADIAGDEKLLSCIEQIISLKQENREEVYNYVDFLFHKKK